MSLLIRCCVCFRVPKSYIQPFYRLAIGSFLGGGYLVRRDRETPTQRILNKPEKPAILYSEGRGGPSASILG